MPFYAPDPEPYAEDHIDGTDQFLKTLSIYIYIIIYIYLSIDRSIDLSIYLSIYITQINPEAVGKAMRPPCAINMPNWNSQSRHCLCLPDFVLGAIEQSHHVGAKLIQPTCCRLSLTTHLQSFLCTTAKQQSPQQVPSYIAWSDSVEWSLLLLQDQTLKLEPVITSSPRQPATFPFPLTLKVCLANEIH